MPLPSRNRLNLRRIGGDFYDKSRKVHTSCFTAFYLPSSLGYPRFSIIVSKKVAALAVDRNLLRRQISAIIQKKIPTINNSLDVVLSLKAPAKNLPLEELNKSISSFLTDIS